MDRATIQDLYEYTGFAWEQIAGEVVAAGEEIIAKPVPGSGWLALRDCLAHMGFAYDVWVTRLNGNTMLELPKDASWQELLAYRHTVRERFKAYLHELSDDELYTVRDVEAFGGTLRYPPADILANVVTHDIAHLGDVSTLLYQLGLEMPSVGYRFYTAAKYEYS